MYATASQLDLYIFYFSNMFIFIVIVIFVKL